MSLETDLIAQSYMRFYEEAKYIKCMFGPRYVIPYTYSM